MYKKFKLDKQKVSALKEICKKENIIQIKSVYGGIRLGFIVSKQWRKENPLFFIEDEINRYHIESYFKMISQFNIMSNNFIKKHSLTDSHLILLRDSYYCYYHIGEINVELEDDDDLVDGFIMLDYKRPFGNSCVIGDVFHAFGMDSYDEEYKNIDIEVEYEYLIDDTINIIWNYFIEEPFDDTLTIQSKGRLYWYMEVVQPEEKTLFEKFKKLFSWY